jgi:hypothetical protein
LRIEGRKAFAKYDGNSYKNGWKLNGNEWEA